MSRRHVKSRLRAMRKHERLIADVIATQPSEADRFTLASLFATALRRDSERFDTDRFMWAAGVRGWGSW